MQPRYTRLRSRSMDDYDKATSDNIHAVYFDTLDIVLAEMKRRFQENDDILLAICNAKKMELDLLKPLMSLNRINSPDANEWEIAKKYVESQVNLELDQVYNAKVDSKNAGTNVADSISDENDTDEDDVTDTDGESHSEMGQIDEKRKKSVLEHLHPVRAAFPQVYKLFCAIETFPCSTTISECSFSTLALIGIFGRIHMTNKRLRDLTFLAFERKQLSKITSDEILRHFNDQKDRKLRIY